MAGLVFMLTTPTVTNVRGPRTAHSQQQQWADNGQTGPAHPVARFGYPTGTPLLARSGYVASYSDKHRTANWVCEFLTPGSGKGSASRKKSSFKEDPSVLEQFRSTLADYKRSGFDRGHLAPAGNHKATQQSMDETFYLSNMSPQVGEMFNRGAWNELEEYVRSLTAEYGQVHVCSGPLYLPKRLQNGKRVVSYEVIGQSPVSVPTHFFKVLVGVRRGDSQPEIQAFIMPNEPIPSGLSLARYLVPLAELESAAGYVFFPRIHDKHRHVLRAPNGSLAGKFRPGKDKT